MNVLIGEILPRIGIISARVGARQTLASYQETHPTLSRATIALFFLIQVTLVISTILALFPRLLSTS